METASLPRASDSGDEGNGNVSAGASVANKSKNLSISDLMSCFHLPINDAAKQLGTCVTVLKKQCRRHGVKRWPYRKLVSIDKLIDKMEKEQTTADDKEYYLHELHTLRQRKEHIFRSAGNVSAATPSRAAKGTSSATSDGAQTPSSPAGLSRADGSGALLDVTPALRDPLYAMSMAGTPYGLPRTPLAAATARQQQQQQQQRMVAGMEGLVRYPIPSMEQALYPGNASVGQPPPPPSFPGFPYAMPFAPGGFPMPPPPNGIIPGGPPSAPQNPSSRPGSFALPTCVLYGCECLSTGMATSPYHFITSAMPYGPPPPIMPPVDGYGGGLRPGAAAPMAGGPKGVVPPATTDGGVKQRLSSGAQAPPTTGAMAPPSSAAATTGVRTFPFDPRAYPFTMAAAGVPPPFGPCGSAPGALATAPPAGWMAAASAPRRASGDEAAISAPTGPPGVSAAPITPVVPSAPGGTPTSAAARRATRPGGGHEQPAALRSAGPRGGSASAARPSVPVSDVDGVIARRSQDDEAIGGDPANESAVLMLPGRRPFSQDNALLGDADDDRRGVCRPGDAEVNGSGSGSGSVSGDRAELDGGSGSGSGSGDANGSGSGSGSGSGDGNGSGDGDGSGDGNGSGPCDGNGSGSGGAAQLPHHVIGKRPLARHRSSKSPADTNASDTGMDVALSSVPPVVKQGALTSGPIGAERRDVPTGPPAPAPSSVAMPVIGARATSPAGGNPAPHKRPRSTRHTDVQYHPHGHPSPDGPGNAAMGVAGSVPRGSCGTGGAMGARESAARQSAHDTGVSGQGIGGCGRPPFLRGDSPPVMDNRGALAAPTGPTTHGSPRFGDSGRGAAHGHHQHHHRHHHHGHMAKSGVSGALGGGSGGGSGQQRRHGVGGQPPNGSVSHGFGPPNAASAAALQRETEKARRSQQAMEELVEEGSGGGSSGGGQSVEPPAAKRARKSSTPPSGDAGTSGSDHCDGMNHGPRSGGRPRGGVAVLTPQSGGPMVKPQPDSQPPRQAAAPNGSSSSASGSSWSLAAAHVERTKTACASLGLALWTATRELCVTLATGDAALLRCVGVPAVGKVIPLQLDNAPGGSKQGAGGGGSSGDGGGSSGDGGASGGDGRAPTMVGNSSRQSSVGCVGLDPESYARAVAGERAEWTFSAGDRRFLQVVTPQLSGRGEVCGLSGMCVELTSMAGGDGRASEPVA